MLCEGFDNKNVELLLDCREDWQSISRSLFLYVFYNAHIHLHELLYTRFSSG